MTTKLIMPDNISALPTLVVFCKRPKLGQGKQRLTQVISREQALVIAQALLACAIEDTKAWQGAVVIACSDHCDVEWAQALNDKADVITQLPVGETGNMGQRLNHIDSELRALGHNCMITIGTDAPALTCDHYLEAVKSLNNNDIVLSHAQDGGVVMMANNKPWPNIIDLPWSEDDLSQSLSDICINNQLSVEYIAPSYDIDYVDDIKKLINDIKNDPRPARQALLSVLHQQFVTSGVINHA